MDLLHYRATVTDDVYNIITNEYLNVSKDFIIKGLCTIPTLKAWTFINGTKTVAIVLANEFYKDFYSVGIVVCKDITYTELKYLKKSVKEIINNTGAKYVYSEGEKHKVKDRFHKFMGFEIEKNIQDIYIKWNYKGI